MKERRKTEGKTNTTIRNARVRKKKMWTSEGPSNRTGASQFTRTLLTSITRIRMLKDDEMNRDISPRVWQVTILAMFSNF
jgi:hypothetical protein